MDNVETQERASMVWCGVVGWGVVWCGVVWCGGVGCGVVWCGVVWCGVVWNSILPRVAFSSEATSQGTQNSTGTSRRKKRKTMRW